MMYRVPMPTKANGVKLHKIGDHEIGIEYTEGEPHVGKMAHDSAYGITSKVTFRRPRPDIDRIIADAVRRVDAQDALPKGTGIERGRGAMKPRGGLSINDEDPDQDEDTYADPQEVAVKVIAYLKDIISAEDLEAVNGLLMGTEADADEGRLDAVDRARGRRTARRQAQDADFHRLFPDAAKLLQR